jgi:hypothetical protein
MQGGVERQTKWRPCGSGRGGRGGIKSITTNKKMIVYSPENSDNTSKDIWYEIE